MNRIATLLSVLILLALSACTFQLPGFEQPTAIVPPTETPFVAAPAPSDTLVPTALPAVEDTAPPPAAAQATPAAPTATPLPPATSEPQSADVQPTATQPPPAPTATPTPTAFITFDPDAALGTPTYRNPMEVANFAEWSPPETDALPDNRDIRLEFRDGELYVRGKRPGFSTWWFSYHDLDDAYIEMTFDSENCSGEDAYGLIFHGPPHRAGQSYGYIVAFTCSGRLWVYRLDGVDPWDAQVLVDEDRSSAVDTGSDEQNVIGVRTEGDQFTVFANDIQVAQVEDDHYEDGRVGVYVRAASDDYVYRVRNFAYWTLGDE